ncbi:MAG: nucleotidyltransferase domain-containing protein [Deltaproteobacteria bacterium]|nr:nucleotidyltransferase domain-containing protein [Deltaproteobacteria bacterium]
MTTEELKNHIATYCATRPEIMACYLFGSRAVGKERAGSDVDVAFLLNVTIPPADYYNLKMTYYSGLERALRHDIHPLIMNDAAEVVLGQVFGKGDVVYLKDAEELRSFRRRKLPLIAEFSYYIDMRLNSLRSRYGGEARG